MKGDDKNTRRENIDEQAKKEINIGEFFIPNNRKVILVVDDILYVVKSIEKILKEAGYLVITAQSGKEALQKFEKYSPRLVTIDQKLPDMLGTTLVKHIRDMNGGSDTKIIFISAMHDRDLIKSVLQLGVNNFLIKPFEKLTLLEYVKKALNNS